VGFVAITTAWKNIGINSISHKVPLVIHFIHGEFKIEAITRTSYFYCAPMLFHREFSKLHMWAWNKCMYRCFLIFPNMH